MSNCSATRSARKSGATRPRIRIARSLNLPVIATNGVRYATAYDREIQDLFTAIRHHVELDQAGRLLALNSQRHLRSGAGDGGAVPRCSRSSREHRANFRRGSNFELSDLGYEFPRYPVPDGETMDSFLRKRVAEGVAAALRTQE